MSSRSSPEMIDDLQEDEVWAAELEIYGLN